MTSLCVTLGWQDSRFTQEELLFRFTEITASVGPVHPHSFYIWFLNDVRNTSMYMNGKLSLMIFVGILL